MRRRKTIYGGAVALALLVSTWTTAYAQDGSSDISGQVVNGTTGVETVDGVTLTLHVFHQGELAETRTVAPGADGRFVFKEVAHQGEPLYVLIATYHDIPYSVELRPDSALGDVHLAVYEPTGSLDALAAASDSLFILGADSGSRTLSALEVIEVVNDADRTFLPDLAIGEAMAFLRFPLPPGAFNLQVESELPQGQVLQIDRGFALTTPVPPGEHGIAFTYTIPYSGRELELSRSFPHGAGVFRLFVTEDLGSVIADGLDGLGSMPIGNTVYQGFVAGELGRGERVEVTLAGLPEPSVWQRLREGTSLGSWGTASIPLAFALALSLLLIIALLRGRRAEPAGSIPQDRLTMMRALADLDGRFQQGEVEEEEYRARRQDLKAWLLRLVQRQEAP